MRYSLLSNSGSRSTASVLLCVLYRCPSVGRDLAVIRNTTLTKSFLHRDSMMASQPLKPYVLEGHDFDFVDGLPIRKCRRNAPIDARGAENECRGARDSSLQRARHVREPLTFCTPTAPDGQPEHRGSPLLQLSQTAQAALLQAAAQESSPAVVKVLQCVSQQCPDAIQAASHQTAAVGSVAAVQQAAVEMVLQQQHRLQMNLDQLRQQEGQVQLLTDDVTSLEQLTHSARKHLHGSAEEAASEAEQPAADLEVKALRCLVEYMNFLKSKSDAVSKDLEVWFKEKISRKLPYTDDPIKALGMLH